MAGEKPEKATPKRKQDERKKGNVFQSREIVIVFSLLASFYGLQFLGPYMINAIQQCIRDFFNEAATVRELGYSEVILYFIDGCGVFLVAAMPMQMAVDTLVLVARVGQVTSTSTSTGFSLIMPRVRVESLLFSFIVTRPP